MDKNDQIYLTEEGLRKLKDELNELLETRRPEIAKNIQDARDMGDISENSAYDAAKQEQAFVEGRSDELMEIVKKAQIAKPAEGGVITVGNKVVVHIDGDEEEYHIVGAPEANPMERKISHESPLGAALLGKKVGDKVKIQTEVGELTYTVLKVH